MWTYQNKAGTYTESSLLRLLYVIYSHRLEHLIKDRTTLIIAHRLSTIREADTIIFLEEGNIIEQGSHKSLMNKGGAYANYCNLQENLVTI